MESQFTIKIEQQYTSYIHTMYMYRRAHTLTTCFSLPAFAIFSSLRRLCLCEYISFVSAFRSLTLCCSFTFHFKSYSCLDILFLFRRTNKTWTHDSQSNLKQVLPNRIRVHSELTEWIEQYKGTLFAAAEPKTQRNMKRIPSSEQQQNFDSLSCTKYTSEQQ